MEHIVQFGIGIDDEAIRKIIMEKAEKSITQDLMKQIRTDIGKCQSSKNGCL